MPIITIIKRDGRKVPYDVNKVVIAISKAMAGSRKVNKKECVKLAKMVESELLKIYDGANPTVEQIQDCVEKVLMENGYSDVAKKYILYRADRTKIRELNSQLMRIYDELTFVPANDSDIKRDNANIDSDSPMGTMLKYGSEGAKSFYAKSLLTTEQSKAFLEGDIHIHDFDFYALTTTCCQIDLISLFENGFCTGHGFLREPNDIRSYGALAAIAIQANQNDQHGGQSIPNFDYAMALGVGKTYKKLYIENFVKIANLLHPQAEINKDRLKEIVLKIETEQKLKPILSDKNNFKEVIKKELNTILSDEQIENIHKMAVKYAYDETDRATFQTMEALVHNLNTMHSRAGAQVPFSSINYGMDTSPEGRMVMKNLLLATEAGLGMGETAIFPIQIFRVKEGVNFNSTDPNYDLFKLACKVSAKRLFPNFSFIDAPFNLQYYKEGHPETEIAYMGCRTRVMGNVHDKTREISYGRGNLSFTTINLPRLGLESKGDISRFYKLLDSKMELVARQLLDRFKIQSNRRVRNYPFLMGQGVWIDSDKLNVEDTVGEVLKHGTLSIGFIGLAETLVAMTGKHHGEDEQSRKLGLEIIKYMRDFCDRKSNEMGLNFTLLATPAEGLAGRFVGYDKKKYGAIKGVTDRIYYTNSFHIPVYYKISALDKIRIEAPYHALTNAGHITYVELDGNTANNIEAFEKIVRYMKECGIGYGSINHPVDRDPVCKYNGIINDVCPKCGRSETEDEPKFERIRRITGYLVGTLDRFNNAKRAEEHDRVKHNV